MANKTKFLPRTPSDFVFCAVLFVALAYGCWVVLTGRLQPSYFPGRYLIPGISVALLGFVAGAMALLNREPSAIERALWIFLFGLLTFTKIHVIQQDRQNQDSQQKKDRDTQDQHFQQVLSQEKDDFKTTLEGLTEGFDNTLSQQRTGFTVMLTQNREHFDRTFS